jgi:ribulose kinase
VAGPGRPPTPPDGFLAAAAILTQKDEMKDLEQQREAFETAVRVLCEAAEIDPGDVETIHIKAYETMIVVFEKNEDGERYLTDDGEIAKLRIRMPGKAVGP